MLTLAACWGWTCRAWSSHTILGVHHLCRLGPLLVIIPTVFTSWLITTGQLECNGELGAGGTYKTNSWLTVNRFQNERAAKVGNEVRLPGPTTLLTCWDRERNKHAAHKILGLVKISNTCNLLLKCLVAVLPTLMSYRSFKAYKGGLFREMWSQSLRNCSHIKERGKIT